MILCFFQTLWAAPYEDTKPWWKQTTDPVLQKLVQQAIEEANQKWEKVLYHKDIVKVLNEMMEIKIFDFETVQQVIQEHDK